MENTAATFSHAPNISVEIDDLHIDVDFTEEATETVDYCPLNFTILGYVSDMRQQNPGAGLNQPFAGVDLPPLPPAQNQRRHCPLCRRVDNGASPSACVGHAPNISAADNTAADTETVQAPITNRVIEIVQTPNSILRPTASVHVPDISVEIDDVYLNLHELAGNTAGTEMVLATIEPALNTDQMLAMNTAGNGSIEEADTETDATVSDPLVDTRSRPNGRVQDVGPSTNTPTRTRRKTTTAERSTEAAAGPSSHDEAERKRKRRAEKRPAVAKRVTKKRRAGPLTIREPTENEALQVNEMDGPSTSNNYEGIPMDIVELLAATLVDHRPNGVGSSGVHGISFQNTNEIPEARLALLPQHVDNRLEDGPIDVETNDAIIPAMQLLSLMNGDTVSPPGSHLNPEDNGTDGDGMRLRNGRRVGARGSNYQITRREYS